MAGVGRGVLKQNPSVDVYIPISSVCKMSSVCKTINLL